MSHADGVSSRRASRGLGLEIVRQLVAVPNNVVFAACRNPEKATALKALDVKGALHVITLDLVSEDSIVKAAKEVDELLAGAGLDYLFNSAAVVSLSALHTAVSSI